jgi:RimJ/RimL family protein N-acetyltransferase
MGDVSIRPATPEDTEAMLDVVEAVAAEGRWIGTEAPIDRGARAAALRASFAAPATGASFVAVDAGADGGGSGGGGRVVGSIDLRLAPYGVVDIGMALLDGYRGQGHGTRLLDAGLAWARSSGGHKASLQVWPHNAGAIALYERAGFQLEGRLRSHYRRRNGERWDALVLGLLLDGG